MAIQILEGASTGLTRPAAPTTMTLDHYHTDPEPRRARRHRLTQRVAERRLEQHREVFSHLPEDAHPSSPLYFAKRRIEGCSGSKRIHGAPRRQHRACCAARARIYRWRAAVVRLARHLLSGADPMGDTVFRLGEPGRKPKW